MTTLEAENSKLLALIETESKNHAEEIESLKAAFHTNFETKENKAIAELEDKV